MLWAPPVLVSAGYGLGILAWMLSGLRLDDAAYKAFGLLAQTAPYQDLAGKDAPWQMHAARWLAVAGVFWAAVAAFWRLLRDDITRLRGMAGAFPAVIIGQGPLALAAWRDVSVSVRTLWLGASRLSSGWRKVGLPWAEGSVDRRGIETHADHARHVLIAGLSAPDAILAARAARTASARAAITVLLADATAASQARALLDDPACSVTSEAALAARALHRNHPAFLSAHARALGRIRLLLIGFGATGQAIARDMILTARTTYLDIPEIIVVDPAASDRIAAWRARAPELDLTARFVPIDGRVCHESPPPGLADIEGGVTRACVCLDSDAATLSCLSALEPTTEAVALAEADLFVRLRAKDLGREGAGFTAFGDPGAVLGESGFMGADPDVAARAYHAAWLAAQEASPLADRDNPAAVPWEDLAFTYKDASRAAVAHIPAKLASAGIEPAAWLGRAGLPQLPEGAALFRTEAELMVLAALEHERWNAERRLDGWTYANLPRKDEASKRHPSLVPFEALAPMVQAYDVAFIRETAGMLEPGESAQASYAQR
jgi:hypothetical protein